MVYRGPAARETTYTVRMGAENAARLIADIWKEDDRTGRRYIKASHDPAGTVTMNEAALAYLRRKPAYHPGAIIMGNVSIGGDLYPIEPPPQDC